MSETPAAVPEGYEPMPEGLGFADRLRPFYRRRRGREVSFGLLVDTQHLNMMGICHGGALMTLADVAAATSIHVMRDAPAPSPTINLSFDFQSPGRKGHWLHTQADHVDLKRRFGFCSGVILDGEKIVLRFSGTFLHGEAPTPEEGQARAKVMSLLMGDDAPLS